MNPSSPTNLLNPSNPLSPLSPLNPANPVGIYNNDSGSGGDISTEAGLLIIGIIIVIGFVIGYLIYRLD